MLPVQLKIESHWVYHTARMYEAKHRIVATQQSHVSRTDSVIGGAVSFVGLQCRELNIARTATDCELVQCVTVTVWHCQQMIVSTERKQILSIPRSTRDAPRVLAQHRNSPAHTHTHCHTCITPVLQTRDTSTSHLYHTCIANTWHVHFTPVSLPAPTRESTHTHSLIQFFFNRIYCLRVTLGLQWLFGIVVYMLDSSYYSDWWLCMGR